MAALVILFTGYMIFKDDQRSNSLGAKRLRAVTGDMRRSRLHRDDRRQPDGIRLRRSYRDDIATSSSAAEPKNVCPSTVEERP